MKKLLLAIIIFVIFISFATPASAGNPPPPFDIRIKGEEELSEARKMVEADREDFFDYLIRTRKSVNYTSRRDIINLLEIFDSLPPYTSEIQFEYIRNLFSTKITYIVFSTDIGERYSFRYIEEYIDREHLKFLFELDMNFENRVKVYSSADSKDFALNWRGDITFIMDIDDFILRVTYNRGENNEHILSVNPEEMFKFLYGVEPWVDEPEPEPLTTADALIILQAAVGLATLSDEDIARFGIDDTPTTADALRVLRLAVGL
jgi:hypothetical protein